MSPTCSDKGHSLPVFRHRPEALPDRRAVLSVEIRMIAEGTKKIFLICSSPFVVFAARKKHGVMNMYVTKSGKKLESIIKKAIDDSVITSAEYEEIIDVAYEDGRLDLHEKTLLKEFKNLIANKTVKRVP